MAIFYFWLYAKKKKKPLSRSHFSLGISYQLTINYDLFLNKPLIC